jgi:hypothetical protein
MFVLTLSNVWSFSFFFLLTYLTIFMSLVIYLLPIVLSSYNLNTSSKLKNNFYIISAPETTLFFFTPLFCTFLLNYCWSSSDLTIWFGHIMFTSFQSKMLYLIFFVFYVVLYFINATTYFSSNEIYDFIITQFNFLYWITILFMSNSIFTLMFVIEVISTLIFLLITTSVFSTTFFYKNINFDTKNFFQNVTPFTFLHSLFFFFLNIVNIVPKLVRIYHFYLQNFSNTRLILNWACFLLPNEYIESEKSILYRPSLILYNFLYFFKMRNSPIIYMKAYVLQRVEFHCTYILHKFFLFLSFSILINLFN